MRHAMPARIWFTHNLIMAWPSTLIEPVRLNAPVATRCRWWLSAILMLAAALLPASNAAAKWHLISEERGTKLYVDKTDIDLKGTVATMWTLVDYRDEQVNNEKRYFSVKRRDEYDCAKRRYRLLATSWFAGKMATGKLVYTSPRPAQEWHEVIPGSSADTRWKISCEADK